MMDVDEVHDFLPQALNRVKSFRPSTNMDLSFIELMAVSIPFESSKKPMLNDAMFNTITATRLENLPYDIFEYIGHYLTDQHDLDALRAVGNPLLFRKMSRAITQASFEFRYSALLSNSQLLARTNNQARVVKLSLAAPFESRIKRFPNLTSLTLASTLLSSVHLDFSTLKQLRHLNVSSEVSDLGAVLDTVSSGVKSICWKGLYRQCAPINPSIFSRFQSLEYLKIASFAQFNASADECGGRLPESLRTLSVRGTVQLVDNHCIPNSLTSLAACHVKCSVLQLPPSLSRLKVRQDLELIEADHDEARIYNAETTRAPSTQCKLPIALVLSSDAALVVMIEDRASHLVQQFEHISVYEKRTPLSMIRSLPFVNVPM